MPLDIVTFDDLKKLSGLKSPEPLIQWLTDSNIHYWVDAGGKPVTIKDHLITINTAPAKPSAMKLPPKHPDHAKKKKP